MAIKPRGDSFLVSLTYKGKRFRKTVKDLDEAERVEAQARADFLSGNDPTTGSGIGGSNLTMKDLFLKTKVEAWRNPNSKPRRNAELLLDLLGWWNQAPMLITPEMLSDAWELLRDRGNSESTVNRYKASMSKMFSVAVELGWIDRKPGGLKQTKEKQGRIRFLTEFEEARFLKVARGLGRDELVSFVIVLLDTGARVSEALAIKERDITEKGVYLDTRKGGSPRLIPLTDRARENLLKWPSLTQNVVNNQWDQVRELIGFLNDSDFTPHVCRHTCASRLVMGGMDLRRVKEWLGHKSINTTMRYAHLMPDALNGGVEILQNASS